MSGPCLHPPLRRVRRIAAVAGVGEPVAGGVRPQPHGVRRPARSPAPGRSAWALSRRAGPGRRAPTAKQGLPR